MLKFNLILAAFLKTLKNNIGVETSIKFYAKKVNKFNYIYINLKFHF